MTLVISCEFAHATARQTAQPIARKHSSFTQAGTRNNEAATQAEKQQSKPEATHTQQRCSGASPKPPSTRSNEAALQAKSKSAQQRGGKANAKPQRVMPQAPL